MSEWRKHVKKTYDDMKKKNSNVLLKHAMKAASKTWKKKTQKKGGNCGGDNETPVEEPTSVEGGEEPVEEAEIKATDPMGGTAKPRGGKKSKKGGKTKKNRK